MFRQWLYIGLLVLIGTPLWAQDNRAIRREREERLSEQRVALIIGNGQYEHIDTLKNPVNDAQGMARVLRNIGFEVIELVNGNRTAMRDSINQFEALIHREVEVALFYFAGHGLQARDEDHSKNYLVPIDANVQREHEVPEACISANWVLRMLQAREGNRVNLIILDACRNNPFESRSFRTTGGQGVVGLAGMGAPSGSVIAYAADAGQVASDGEGRHSPYTGSLISHINTPGATIFDVFTRVAGDVQNATQHLTSPQEPWLRTNLTQNFSLIPSSPNPPDSTTSTDPPPLPQPLCAGQPAGSACWMELANQPQCYIWNPYFWTNETVTWDGQCSGGFAQGRGTLKWSKRSHSQKNEKIRIIIRVMGQKDEEEGSFLNGKKHGHWVIRSFQMQEEGPYVYGEQTGDWIIRSVHGTVNQGPYVNSKRHGRWTIRYADGAVSQGPYVYGEQTGDWIIRSVHGTVNQGPYVSGKRHGRWTIRYADGIVFEGHYVDDERHGRWIRRYRDGKVRIINYKNGKIVKDSWK